MLCDTKTSAQRDNQGLKARSSTAQGNALGVRKN